MTIIKCEKCGADAEVDYTGMVVCTNKDSCGFSYYDPLMDERKVVNFQSFTQQLVKDSSADWTEYKNWCSENGKNVNDARVLIFYVEKVLGG